MTRWPDNNALLGDPARQKSRYLGGPGAADYFNRVKAYNVGLYQPSDTIPSPAALPLPIAPLSTSRGWQGPANPVGAGDYASRYGTASVSYGGGGGLAGPSGATGATGSTGDMQSPGNVPGMPPGWHPPAQPSIIDTAPRAQMPDVAPQQNAQQRWMGSVRTPEGPVNPGSTDRYYDRKFARNSRDLQQRMQARAIDGRSPNVNGQQPYSPAPVIFNQGKKNEWSPY